MDAASLSAGEQVLPRPAARCKARKEPQCPEGSLPRSLPWQRSHLPVALQSLRELILAQTFVPTCPRKLTLWQLQTTPSLPVFPLLTSLCSSQLLLKDHQARLTLWHGPVAVLHFPRLVIFPISSISEALFIKSSTGAQQHPREALLSCNHPQLRIPPGSQRLRFEVWAISILQVLHSPPNPGIRPFDPLEVSTATTFPSR